jgi:hypothetical protein
MSCGLPRRTIPQSRTELANNHVARGDAAGATRPKTYADWQGPLTQSFGIRFLAPRTAWDPIAGAPPSRSFSLQIFDGLEKMQVWHEFP